MPSPTNDETIAYTPERSAPPSSAIAGSLEDPRVLHALQEYMTRLESIDPPDRDAFLAAHGDIAEPLAKCLDGLSYLWTAAPRLRGLSADALPSALGDFRILRELGRGGMGTVYEAEQLSLARRVALKVLPFAAALDTARLQRFKNEAQAAAQLHHTNIVPVYAVGCDRGVHFYAMQLIAGRTLAELIVEVRREKSVQSVCEEDGTTEWTKHSASKEVAAREATLAPPPTGASSDLHLTQRETSHSFDTDFAKQLSADRNAARAKFYRRAAQLGIQAADALTHAHEMGVIHRDIKPGNLLVDADGKLWVTDFGLAQFHDVGGLTISGSLPGTIRYMSPEQAAGQRVLLDHRTDIYSLGVTLYELVTFQPAFDERDGRILVRQIVTEEPPAPRTIDRAIPQDLETILLKAMAKAPGDRYATAAALSDDLQRFLDHQPIRARRPSIVELMAKWARRHKPLVGASVLLLLLTTIGLIAATLAISREHAATKMAYRREIEQRMATERNFRQARQAVDTFAQLSEEELAARPEMYQLRRKFLSTALDYYESFLNEHGNDPIVSSELTATRAQVARIVDELSVLSSFGPLMLLSNEMIRQEIDANPEQQTQIAGLVDELWSQRAAQRRNETAEQSSADLQRQLATILRLHNERMSAILSTAQMHRLQQIWWQQLGPFAFRRPEVIDALDLSADDRKKITEIIERNAPHRNHGPGGPKEGARGRPEPPHRDMNAATDDITQDHSAQPQLDSNFERVDRPKPKGKPRELTGQRQQGEGHGPPPFGNHPPGPPRDFGGGPFGSHEDMRATMNRTVAEIVEALTPAQRTAWNKLVGEPVDFDLPTSPDDQLFWFGGR